jgi:cytochrome bd ubiquinol oxidase subunit II
METLWFWLVALMLATFVVLDGFDLGTGILYLFVARSEDERSGVLGTVGPVWDGNEVWLVAGGGALFLAFPTLYAVSFSGFYLPLMMVLWLLMGRALGIEMRHQMDDPLWTDFWDAVFAVSSGLLALFLGVALGNVIRGVPLSEEGLFFEPLWTNFRVGASTGILDWFTLVVGLNSVAALAYHAALWLDWRGGEAVRKRVAKAVPALFVSLLVLSVATIAATVSVQPLVSEHLSARPWAALLPLTAIAAMAASLPLHRLRRRDEAFVSSSLALYGMILGAAAALYPYVLPARVPEWGLDVYRASSSEATLRQALYWFVPGMILAASYTVFVYRRLLSGDSGGDAAVLGSSGGHGVGP